MALTRNKKQEMLEDYRGGFASAPHAVVVGFKGLTVPQATDLRQKIREGGGRYQVVKNTLARLAVEGKDMGVLVEHFQGATAVAFSDDAPVALAKALTEFRKDVPVLEFKAGLVEGQPVAAEDVESIAKMPTREELLAKLLFLLQSPVTRFVRTLAAVPRDFVVVLNQISQKKTD